MKSNHPFIHEEEVEAEGTGYQKWKLQVNALTAIDVNDSDLIKFLSGDGITFQWDAGAKSLTVIADKRPFIKPNKPINDPTYIIESGDSLKWLVFNVSCTVTVPKGLNVHDIFEGEANTGATVTFQEATGASLRHVASVSKILSPNAPFGIRVKATDDYTLYGTDPVNYNA